MSDNWIVSNLEKALGIWNDKLAEIWILLTQDPRTFKGGSIWSVIVGIHGTMQAIGLALLVLFFVMGVMKTCGSFAELKRPEMAVRLFVRFAVAKAAITYGMDLMLSILSIVQGIISRIVTSTGAASATADLPAEIVTAVESTGFLASIPLWFVSLIGGILVWALSFIMVLSVYGRFFRLYMFTALAPIPISTFAGQPTENVGKSFIRAYTAVCLEGALVALACVIFSAYASSTPVVDPEASAVTMIWSYMGEVIFNMLILVGLIKASDRAVKEMMGL